MELFLNLASSLVAVALVCLWLRHAGSCSTDGASRRTQIVALALLILILFPVISVTDDLMAAENPAETDSFQRRGHQDLGPHAAPAVITPDFELAAVDLPAETWSHLGAQVLEASLPPSPSLSSIENRPPPIA